MNPEQWAAISELFERGLPLSERERNGLLADNVKDPEIAAHLRELWKHGDVSGFMERPLLGTIRSQSSGESSAAPSPGETALDSWPPTATDGEHYIGKYRVISVLGEGGMGVVYLAAQQQPIFRLVAIKVIKANMSSRGVLLRFEAERQTLALMDHPNIAQIYEADVGADGQPYFVMEYVQGLPITDYCDRNLLGCRDRLLLFQQVCNALQHAHQRGIIHRDLKPSNILIAVKDGIPVPKIIDFGVAKALNQRLQENTAFTEFGMLIGTPEYMSPEQAEHSADVDTTSDVYSLGVVLYELLAGDLPFDPKNLRKAGLAEIQRVIREDEAPRPATRVSSLGKSATEVARKRRTDVPSLLRQLRGDLDWIVMKALEKDRTRRYSSASEFAADIGRNLSDEPVLAGPPSLLYKLSKYARRHRFEFAAAATVVLAIVAGLVTSTLLYFRSERARTLAEKQAYRASLAAARSSIEGWRGAEAQETLLAIPTALRKWEWRYLYWLSDNSLTTLNSGEGGAHIHIGFNSEKSLLFVATDTSVHAWTLGSWRRIHDYGPFAPLLSMSPDGSLVVSEANSDRSAAVEISETASRKVIGHLETDAPLVDASFDAHARILATLDQKSQVRIWDVPSQRLVVSIPPSATPTPRLTGRDHDLIAVSPDGSVVAKTEYNNIRLYNVTSGSPRAFLPGNHTPVQGFSFTPDSRRLVSASGSVMVWDVTNGKQISESTYQKAFSNVVVNPATGIVGVAAWYHAVHFFDTAARDAVETSLTPTVPTIAALAWSPYGEYLIGVDFMGGVHVWEGETLGGQNLQLLSAAPATDYDSTRFDSGFGPMVLSSDGRRLVVAAPSEIRIIDTSSAKPLAILKGTSFPVHALALQPRGDILASGCDDKAVTVWSISSRVPLRQLQGHSDAVTALAYSPDGATLVSGSSDRTVRFWDAETGELRFSRKLPGKVLNLVTSPDGRTVAVVLEERSYYSEEPFLQLLDMNSGSPLPSLERIDEYRSGGGYSQDIAFSPDSKWLASADGGVLGAALWDVPTGKLVRRLASVGRQGYQASGFAFSPDGQRIAAAYQGGNIAIWDPNNGDLLLELLADARYVRFSPDGSRLYVNAVNSIEVLDSRPAFRPEARQLLHALSERYPLLCDLRKYLRDSNIDSGLKSDALRLSDHSQDNWRSVRDLVDNPLNSRSGTDGVFQTALQRSQWLLETYPWDQSAMVRLGAAQYRTRKFHEALTTLREATPRDPFTQFRKQLFIAMAQNGLGDIGDARKVLEQTRTRIQQTELPRRDAKTIAALLKEAESQ